MTINNKAEAFLKTLDALKTINLEDIGGPVETLSVCIINGYKLVCTCPACPEQYDVFDKDGKEVGYLRLRHGAFRADVPTCGQHTVYTSSPKGDGIFDDDERVAELTKAVEAIDNWLLEQKSNEPG